MLTVKIIREKIHPDTCSVSQGVFTVRRGFFYTNGYTSARFAQLVEKELPDVEVIDHGEVWTRFNGGESIARQSHWWVRFREKSDVVMARLIEAAAEAEAAVGIDECERYARAVAQKAREDSAQIRRVQVFTCILCGQFIEDGKPCGCGARS